MAGLGGEKGWDWEGFLLGQKKSMPRAGMGLVAGPGNRVGRVGCSCWGDGGGESPRRPLGGWARGTLGTLSVRGRGAGPRVKSVVLHSWEGGQGAPRACSVWSAEGAEGGWERPSEPASGRKAQAPSPSPWTDRSCVALAPPHGLVGGLAQLCSRGREGLRVRAGAGRASGTAPGARKCRPRSPRVR